MTLVLHYNKSDIFAGVFEWDDSVEMCNVGDVLLPRISDMTFHVSFREMVNVLRHLDTDAAAWFYDNVVSKDYPAREYERRSGEVWDRLLKHALPFTDYPMDSEEEKMTMSIPAKKTTAEKAAPKEAKEKAPKKETNPNAAWEKAGFKMDQTIHFGVDKDGKKYDTAENNPKRGMSADRYKIYKEGMTIQQFKDAGGKLPDLKWDTAESRKWIIVK